MSDVVLIEDRSERMHSFLEKRDLDLEQFKLLTIISNELFDILKNEVKKNNFSSLEKFDIIMAHQSAWSQKELSLFKQFCQNGEKLLILFSGGMSSTHFNIKPFPFLVIHVDEFYSQKLALFLLDYFDSSVPNILLLQYGKKWKLSVLMEARNNLKVYLEKNKNIAQLRIRETGIRVPEALIKMHKEFGINVDWYESGIKNNAYVKLKTTLEEITSCIRSEIYSL